jgi:hypothetical protein
MDECCFIDIFYIKHDVLLPFSAILFEDFLFQLEVLLIIWLIGVKVALCIKGNWFLVLAVCMA